MNDKIYKSLVFYLDILGYSEEIEKQCANNAYIMDRETLFNQAITEPLENCLPALDESGDKEISELIKRYYNTFFISDSFIFIVNLDEIITELKKDNLSITRAMCNIFIMITHCYNILLQKGGYLIRGGISYDYHYLNLNKKDNNCFIFSKAYLDAYHLEHKKGINKDDRILTNETTYNELNKYLRNEEINQIFYKQDTTSYYYLNVYYGTEAFFNSSVCANRLDNIKHLIKNLQEIKAKINERINQASNDNDIVLRYRKFAHLHNNKVRLLEEQYKNFLAKKDMELTSCYIEEEKIG